MLNTDAAGDFITCDYCNPDAEIDFVYTLTDEEARIFNVEPGYSINRGYIDSDMQIAAESGWKVCDDGDMCPLCFLDDIRAQDSETVDNQALKNLADHMVKANEPN